jgi:hypothetical protein
MRRTAREIGWPDMFFESALALTCEVWLDIISLLDLE